MTTAVKTDTREKIIALATTLIETKGYNGFSYQDIADSLNIKKASIHYHFPAKEDLGLAVFQAFESEIHKYIGKFDFEKLSATEKMAGYFQYHSDMTMDNCGQISCIGAVTSEWNVLPEKLRAWVDGFNKWHVEFIVSILKEGVEKGEFKSLGSLEEQAMCVIATTKGALLMAREGHSLEMYQSITNQVMRSLKG